MCKMFHSIQQLMLLLYWQDKDAISDVQVVVEKVEGGKSDDKNKEEDGKKTLKVAKGLLYWQVFFSMLMLFPYGYFTWSCDVRLLKY